MTTSTGSQMPSQATSGYIHDTSVEGPSVTPEFMDHGAPLKDPGEALRNPYAAEINRLHSFLMINFPREMQRTNVPNGEGPVDVAIRLLQGLGATGAGPRCSQEYCNLPLNHDGEHGFINYQTR